MGRALVNTELNFRVPEEVVVGGGHLIDQLGAVSLAVLLSDQVELDNVERGNSTKFCIVRDYVIMRMVSE